MRILTFTSLFPNSLAPSSAIFLYQRTSHLARRRDMQVEVMAPLPYAPKFLQGTARGAVASIPEDEMIGNLQVHHPRYPLLPGISMPFHGRLMYSGCLNRARQLHAQHSFDCIDAHYVFPDGLAAVLLGRALGIPVMLTARGTDIHTFPRFRTILPQIRWTLRHAAGLAAVSDSLARIMQELESSIGEVDVIGNGVDGERFYLDDRAFARKRIGVSSQENVIVSVAALRHVKGPDMLVRAAALLKRSTPNCKILFVGKGADLASLQRLAAQLDCADICQFVGAVPNEKLRHYYNAADVTCLPSRNEGWPNVVLESLACGTPVVGTRVGAVPEILNDGDLGIVVDPTPESIHEGLRRAIYRHWKPEVLSTCARAYTWDNVAERVEDFLQRCTHKDSTILHRAVPA